MMVVAMTNKVTAIAITVTAGVNMPSSVGSGVEVVF